MTDEWEGFMKGAGPATAAAWHELITAAPGLYLTVRAEVFGWALATPRLNKCAPIIVGVDSQEPVLLEESGLAERYSEKDDWDTSYSKVFERTPLYSHLFYGALAVGRSSRSRRGAGRRRGGGAGADRGDRHAGLGPRLPPPASSSSPWPATTASLYFLDVAAMAAPTRRVAGPWGIGGPRRIGAAPDADPPTCVIPAAGLPSCRPEGRDPGDRNAPIGRARRRRALNVALGPGFPLRHFTPPGDDAGGGDAALGGQVLRRHPRPLPAAGDFLHQIVNIEAEVDLYGVARGVVILAHVQGLVLLDDGFHLRARDRRRAIARPVR